MFRDREEMHRRLLEIIERFRQKGATSPEKAITIQELGLPSRFEEAMNRRLGQLGIFVEKNGKYYLNEERLKQIQEQRAKGRAGSSGASSHTWSRVVGILLVLPIGIIIALVLYYFVAFSGGFFPGEFLIILVVILLGVTLARLLFWRSRRRYWREQWGRTEQLA
jgi:Flp pilus assembly protein TadB